MAKLKYKDKDGFWQELQVGTKVVVNPGGGKLYKHIITVNGKQVSNNASYYAGWTIIDNHSEPYTFNELIPKYYYYSSGIGMPILVYSLDTTHQRFLALLTYESKIVVGMTEESDFGKATNFKDTVTEL